VRSGSGSGGAGGTSVGSARGAPAGCADTRRLVFRLRAGRARVVSARIYVDGKLVKTLRGLRLKKVGVPGLPARGVHSVRIVVRAADGTRRVTVRRYRGCAKTAPRRRRGRARRAQRTP
jgi:hypothetical protein